MPNAAKTKNKAALFNVKPFAVAGALVIALSSPFVVNSIQDAEATDPTYTFIDVNSNTPHSEDITWLGYNGISQGFKTKSGYVYNGDTSVIRQDMAAFLHRLGQLAHVDNNAVLKEISFEDVDSKTPHANDIMWLGKTGISTGWVEKGKNYFKGDTEITRQDMAAFVHRLADLVDDGEVNGTAKNGKTSLSFADVNSKTPHAEDIAWMASWSISTGWKENGKNYFKGDTTVNRQDMAAFMHRAATSGVLGKIESREFSGTDIARLASAVACTAYPMDEKRISDDDVWPYTWNKNEPRIEKYKRLGEEVKSKTNNHSKTYKGHSGVYDNWAWASCHQAASIIIRAVVDKDMPMNNPGVAKDYFDANPDKWTHVGSVTSPNDPILQPGDILNTTKDWTHTSIYVGKSIAQEYHKGCTGFIWEASYGSNYAYYPGITNTATWGGFGTTYEVYRFTGTPNGVVNLGDYL